MSTRCVINFGKDAKIYRHCDGCPDGVLPDLEKFFTAVEEQCSDDTRFNDPPYLAAKFVVWQAGDFARTKNPLNFLSVGVLKENPLDIEYIYKVEPSLNGRPTVTWKKA